jgi:hypothetical protein
LHLPAPGYASAVIRLHMQLDLDPDDPRTTLLHDGGFREVGPEWLRPLGPSENSAGNPLHLLLGAGLLALYLVKGPRGSATARRALAIGVAAVAGLVIFFVVLRWQRWGARLDLPFFALLAAPLGIGIAALGNRMASWIVALLVVAVLPSLVIAVRRPLVNFTALAELPLWLSVGIVLVQAAVVIRWGPRFHRALAPPANFGAALLLVALIPLSIAAVTRMQGMHARFPPASIITSDPDDIVFRGNAELAQPYDAVIELARESGCRVIGLESERDTWEYPLWAALDAEAGQGDRRLVNVGVTNESARTPSEGSEPCFVIDTRPDPTWTPPPGMVVRVVSAKPYLAVYARD